MILNHDDWWMILIIVVNDCGWWWLISLCLLWLLEFLIVIDYVWWIMWLLGIFDCEWLWLMIDLSVCVMRDREWWWMIDAINCRAWLLMIVIDGWCDWQILKIVNCCDNWLFWLRVMIGCGWWWMKFDVSKFVVWLWMVIIDNRWN